MDLIKKAVSTENKRAFLDYIIKNPATKELLQDIRYKTGIDSHHCERTLGVYTALKLINVERQGKFNLIIIPEFSDEQKQLIKKILTYKERKEEEEKQAEKDIWYNKELNLKFDFNNPEYRGLSMKQKRMRENWRLMNEERELEEEAERKAEYERQLKEMWEQEQQ